MTATPEKASAIAELEQRIAGLDNLPPPTRVNRETGSVDILGDPGDQYGIHVSMATALWLQSQEPFKTGAAWGKLRMTIYDAGGASSIDLPGVTIRAIHKILTSEG